ncbi:fimbrillin family protein [Myroides odoratimimus]|uniref:fimbrillin family protein n=1 Tax=Myroides odoratimimus TaxID=76832 RepID=UPI003100B1A2
MRHLYFFFLIILLSNCTSDDKEEVLVNSIPVQFSAYTISKDSASLWGKSDAIGIFMIENGQILSQESIVDDADNKKYLAKVIANKGNFQPASKQDIIYYPKHQKVDFIGYYPYDIAITDFVYSINVSNQENPREIDLLYSNNAKAIEKSQTPVNMTFEHMLSKLNFTLKAGVGQPDLSKAIIKIEGLNTKADFNLANGILSNKNTLNAITAFNNAAIIIPQEVAQMKVTVQIDNNKFETTLSDRTFSAGKIYSYIVTVNQTGITVTVDGISDWIGKDDEPIEGGAEASQYAVGDYYPDPKAVYKNGELISGNPAIGVVYWIEPHSASKHGKIVSIDQASLVWSVDLKKTDAEHSSYGIYNMRIIADYKDWVSFPSFNWIHQKNKDTTIDYSNMYATGIWYFPAIDELHAIYLAYKKSDTLNKNIQDIGGASFMPEKYYSSTAYSQFNADGVNFKTGEVGLQGKATKAYVRAILAF